MLVIAVNLELDSWAIWPSNSYQDHLIYYNNT